jgi:hypothetical protein
MVGHVMRAAQGPSAPAKQSGWTPRGTRGHAPAMASWDRLWASGLARSPMKRKWPKSMLMGPFQFSGGQVQLATHGPKCNGESTWLERQTLMKRPRLSGPRPCEATSPGPRAARDHGASAQTYRWRNRRPLTKLDSIRTNLVATPTSNAHARSGMSARASSSAGSVISEQTPWTRTLQPEVPSGA